MQIGSDRFAEAFATMGGHKNNWQLAINRGEWACGPVGLMLNRLEQRIDDYLAIEMVRFGDKLRFVKDIDPETLDRLVPSMLLQPLVENSIRHGLSNKVDGGTVRGGATVCPVVMSTAQVLITQSFTFSAASL